MTRTVRVGNVVIGGGNPIVVESMTNTRTDDVPATVDQIRSLVRAGCELVRVAVPDEAAARAIREIKREVVVPIVADIHYDHRLALVALDCGADGLRLNPGNIRDPEKIRTVAISAAERNAPIRVGVNAGSVDPRFTGRQGEITPRGLVDAALWEIRLLEEQGFGEISVSIKAHDVPLTVAANRLLRSEGDWPVHLGITEAGTVWDGAIRSAVGIGILLSEGIGDALRVSLAGDPVREVEAGWEILRALNLRKRGPTFVVCPTCGRAGVDIAGIAHAVRAALTEVVQPLAIAIMGCPVNGLGEAERADFGILGGQGHGTVYAHGRVVLPKVREDRLAEELVRIVRAEVTADGCKPRQGG